MGKSIVHVKFSGSISYEYDDSGDLLDYELFDKAMENFADDPELCGQLAEYDCEIERK
ncbi:hypothetical protein HYQ40_01525 [Aerococcaceae bacterium DSM 111021]|nr:hypothetical protein [Aerococcaceae bacterium DSM 111021]